MAFNIENETEKLLGNRAFQAPAMKNFDVGSYVNQYMPGIKMQEQADFAKSALEKRRMQEGHQQQEQGLMAAQTSRGLGTSGLAEYQRQQLETDQFAELEDKDKTDLLKQEFGRRQKVEDLKQKYISSQVNNIVREHSQNMAKFQNAFAKYRSTVEGKFSQEAMNAQTKLQKQFDDAAMQIQARMKRNNIGKGITRGGLGILGGIAGGLLGAAGGPMGVMMGITGGIQAGQSLGKGIGNIGNRDMYRDINRRYDNLSNQSFY
jgi:hypothetical protein